MQLCKVEGCEQPIADRKTCLCHKHQLRFIRYGTTELSRTYVDHSKKCIVEDCNRKQQTCKGYCLKHYKEWKRKQPTDLLKKCVVCGEPIGYAGCNGMCSKHYNNWLKYGDALHTEERKLSPYGNKRCQYYKTKDGEWLHRVVAENKIGRKLEKNEVVHHVNLNKLDNSEGNLYVCDSSTHMKLHKQLERLAASLIEDGIIIFENGEYKFCKELQGSKPEEETYIQLGFF